MTVSDNLVRTRWGSDAVRAAADGDGNTFHGHFAVFDTWTEIKSYFEGNFLERIAPGAFREVFRNPDGVRVLYDHGHDPSIGSKPIATPDVLREDDVGAYYEAEALDSTYAQELLPAARAGQLGASFRFRVAEEEWVEPDHATERNPGKLKERTITKVAPLYEFGPTPFGAYPEATTGVRSDTDDFFNELRTNPLYVARLTEQVGLNVVEQILSSVPGDDRADPGLTTVGLSLPATPNYWRAKQLLRA